ncbi:RagB/SusD family nutrient uptake outer membrane protein [Carboxylicivirga sp. A043]|uniref:RagB/SusD family nutrient uptake outer membrane protein n=1 Tax=Carboxylicivirga litoralis TaxID=2816963 RepID=UPI0021CAFAE0|nr:RagB/SusD family nutrient uptake outer membrane protein [Carboxylicivirga sp. A043]MCU4157106.1 RagB/SusD family nutrient uptake outer membrane protein [Carboxylicivirga sp. A043]
MKLYSLIVLVALGLVSCDDYLNTEPISQIASNGFYKNTAEVEAGLMAMYDGMQSYDLSNDIFKTDILPREFALTEMRSDNTKSKNSEGEWAQFQDMNVDVSNSTVSNYWLVNYNNIFRANVVIANLEAVTEEATKAQFEAEAKFGRALAHFNLVRAFGDVPLIDKVVSPEDNAANVRVAKSEVYNFIIQDLSDAIDILPTRSDIAEGRATKGAAQTLLGKVYLTIGDHSAAKIQLEAVMTSGDYDIIENYNDVFYDELNDEIIFAIQYIDDDVEDAQDFSYEMTYLGKASGLNYPTDDLMAAVDPADGRFNTLFHFEIGAGSSGRYECGKFRPLTAANSEFAGNDWIVLRYADVLLMYVEAVMGTNSSTNDAGALAAFKEVRARAGFDVSGITEVTKQMLLDERRVELAFENHRLYDLIRFGVAEEVMAAFAQTEEADFNFNATKLLLPIPQRERNLNPDLSQNPGY